MTRENKKLVPRTPEPDQEEPDKIHERQVKQKQELLEQLEKAPIIQIACERTGVGRATFYRWRKEDAEFAGKVEEALEKGSNLINDLAESRLVSAIKDGNFPAVAFWLRSHHRNYTNRIEIAGDSRMEDVELTEEQARELEKALQIADQGEDEKEATEQNDKSPESKTVVS
jgi:hypothetical protein